MRDLQATIRTATEDLSRILIGPQAEVTMEAVSDWVRARLESEGYFVQTISCERKTVEDRIEYHLEARLRPLFNQKVEFTIKPR